MKVLFPARRGKSRCLIEQNWLKRVSSSFAKSMRPRNDFYQKQTYLIDICEIGFGGVESGDELALGGNEGGLGLAGQLLLLLLLAHHLLHGGRLEVPRRCQVEIIPGQVVQNSLALSLVGSVVAQQLLSESEHLLVVAVLLGVGVDAGLQVVGDGVSRVLLNCFEGVEDVEVELGLTSGDEAVSELLAVGGRLGEHVVLKHALELFGTHSQIL